MHPAGGDAVQHRKCLVDQVVIVEQAALLLLAPVVRRRRGCDLQQRLGPVAGRDRTAALDQRSDAVAFQLEQTRNRRMGVTEFFRHHRFTGRAFVREKYPEIFLHLGAADGVQCLPKPCGVALLGLAAGVERCSDLPPARSRQVGPVDDRALDLFDAVGGIDIERCGHLRRGGVGAAGAVGPCHEVIAAQAGLAHHILEGDVGSAGHGDIERPAGRAIGIAGGVEQHLEIGALHHLVLVAVVDHGKTRRHVGFERELLQQPGA